MVLKTIGDHLRKRRLDLGLTQREVASQIGVDPWSVLNWETGKTWPNLRALPGVIRFLGYDPTEPGVTLGERLRSTRRHLGLSQADIAARLGVVPSTIYDWESSQRRPTEQFRRRIEEFLARAEWKRPGRASEPG